MIKGVTLFDIHTPDDDKSCMRAVDKFLPDFKPDYLIWGGDVGNWESFSTWEDGYHGENTTEDFDAVTSVLDRHQLLCGQECKYIWLQGNHDEWVDKYCGQLVNIKIAKEFDFKKRLRLKERKIKFIPINKPFKVGKLRFVHGLYLNEYHSKKTLLAYNTNIVYGHGHTEQSYTYVSPIDSTQVRVGRSRPCLCNRNPDYLRNRPNAWTHGFSVWYVREDGSFNEYCVNITKGIFTFNDKTYDGRN
mgnify:CR=1 FL=1